MVAAFWSVAERFGRQVVKTRRKPELQTLVREK